MQTRFSLCVIAIAAVAAVSAVQADSLTAVPFTDVKVEDHFWAPRIKINREVVLPHNFKYCEDTGRIKNFVSAAIVTEAVKKGPITKEAAKELPRFEGIFFNDSDVYKAIEGAAYSLAHARDEKLEAIVDVVIDKIAAAQLPDGYLYTFYTVNRQLDKRWTDEKKMHETYCAGHLFEAAVAYFQATGKRKLLDVAIRLADHIDSVFGPDKKHDAPGHEEIELGLIKLYRQTGNMKYAKLAQFFVDERGNSKGHALQGEYSQDNVPVTQQRSIVGHAVRAMYLYAGVTDVLMVTGDQKYRPTLDAIFDDVTNRKMYITGGIGPSAHNEGFTVAYDLPNDSAYQETCASIGMALWNHRMALLTGDAKYADVVERVMYNGLLAGVSLDGSHFFYVNPLASKGKHHRQEWFGCACCPTNIVRFLPTVGGYAYAFNDKENAIYAIQYIAGSARVMLDGKPVTLKTETKYPWEGQITVSVQTDAPRTFTLNLRIPAWCQGASLKVNGRIFAMDMQKGYARITREWKSGDAAELELLMPPQRVAASRRVFADLGRVALQRGPIIYCLEAADNNGSTRSLAIPREARLDVEYRPDLLGGVSVIKTSGLTIAPGVTDDSLYHAPAEVKTHPAEIVAVPYYAWDNRSPGEMNVWIPEDPALVELRRAITIASLSNVSASYTNPKDSVIAVNDLIDPASSGDQSVPRFTWWDHKGTAEWIQYDFRATVTVSSVEVYWFDDKGGCRLPESWKVLYKDGETWKPVQAKAECKPAADCFNTLEFAPVTTNAMRIEVQLQKDASGGILEWRVQK